MTLRPGARLVGPVAAALVVATGLVGLAAAPASAAFCSGSGVNVVVDFNGLGGGVQKGCDPAGANRSADRVFPAAGFGLTYAQRQPGFVCRVKQAPQSDPCQNASPANAYWGLYWSDGKSGKWSYSSSGVGGLKVPQGGFVAFSWQNGGAADPPGAAPTNNQPAPKPQPEPEPAPPKQPTKAPGKSPTKSPAPGTTNAPGPGKSPSKPPGDKAATPSERSSSTTSASAGRSPTSDPTITADPTESALPGDSITLEPSDDAEDDTAGQTGGQAEEQLLAAGLDEEPGSLPTWVPVLVLLSLAAAAASAVVWRRRRGL